jgi:hypothetical protein
MSIAEEAFLVLVIASFSLFGLALAYGSWQDARVSKRDKRRGK